MHYFLLAIFFCANIAATDLRPFAGPDAPLAAAREAKAYAQWLALTVGSYDANGIKGAWDAELRRLLDYIDRDRCAQHQDMTADEAAILSKRLLKPGACEDPLAAWAAWALAREDNVRRYTAEQGLAAFDKDAAARPMGARYPRILEAMMAASAINTFSRDSSKLLWSAPTAQAKRMAAAVGASIRANECAVFPAVLAKLLKDFKPDHQDFCEPVVKAVDDAVAEAKIDPWLGNLLRGTIRISNAWAWRGSGWASTVTPEGAEAHERNLKQADDLLTAAWQANPGDPLAPAYACIIAGSGSSAEALEVWLQRSMRACFDHRVSFDVALNFMRPRWGGSYAEMLSLGCDYVNTGRFDTEVPWRIITICATVIQDADQMHADADARAALADQRVSAAVDACLDAYLPLHRDQANRYACLRAAIHWHAGRRELARAALVPVADADLVEQINRDYRVNLREIKGLAPSPANF